MVTETKEELYLSALEFDDLLLDCGEDVHLDGAPHGFRYFEKLKPSKDWPSHVVNTDNLRLAFCMTEKGIERIGIASKTKYALSFEENPVWRKIAKKIAEKYKIRFEHVGAIFHNDPIRFVQIDYHDQIHYGFKGSPEELKDVIGRIKSAQSELEIIIQKEVDRLLGE